MQSFNQLISNTPMTKIQTLHGNKNVQIFAKLEGTNLGGSVKDRAVYNMFIEAEKQGVLNKGDKIIEATSGNTGIALAMIAAIKGYMIELVMPDNSTEERIKTMRAYGARVTLTPADKNIEFSRDYANAKVEKEGYIMFDQFANPNNPLAHYKGTGPEIWRDTAGKITHFVSSMGTTGTIMGVSKYLKEQNPEVQIIGVLPAEGNSIPGIRSWSPEYMPKFYDPWRVDHTVLVTRDQAISTTRQLATKEGILAGMSSGGAMHVALQIAQQLTHDNQTPNPSLIVSVVCDRGDRYLSSDLFE